MTRPRKIAALIAFTIILVPTILMGSCAIRIANYRSRFPEVKAGDSKQAVNDLMGQESKTRRCSFSIYDGNNKYIGNCFEIFTYYGVYEQWEVAFDENGTVIEKYYWFLGEYGNRPPDTN